MRKIFRTSILSILLIVGIEFVSDVEAYTDYTMTNADLASLPKNFYSTVNWDKGIIWCNQYGGNIYCTSAYLPAGYNFTEITFNPTTADFCRSSDLGYASAPYLYFGIPSGNSTTYQNIQAFNVMPGGHCMTSGNNNGTTDFSWENACAKFKTSSSDIPMTNTATGQTCIGPLLKVTLNPQAGGSVESSPAGLNCSSNPCVGSFTQGSVSLTPTASTGYAFGFWDDGTICSTDNPLPITMNSNKTLTAKFFKTFRNAVGSFYNTSGTYGNGECVTYVNNETGITKASGAAFTGNANTYYQEAIDEGYQTSSSIPRIGSIIVFAIDSSKGLDYGHVGIVTAINGTSITIEDQNWVATDTIGSHTEDVSTYNILGYIYYTP